MEKIKMNCSVCWKTFYLSAEEAIKNNKKFKGLNPHQGICEDCQNKDFNDNVGDGFDKELDDMEKWENSL